VKLLRSALATFWFRLRALSAALAKLKSFTFGSRRSDASCVDAGRGTKMNDAKSSRAEMDGKYASFEELSPTGLRAD
jgi:hypothetical protein